MHDKKKLGVCGWSAQWASKDQESVLEYARRWGAPVFTMASWFRSTPSEALAMNAVEDSSSISNFAFTVPRQDFDYLFIGPSVRLYRGSFYQAFLRRCAQFLKPDGRLAVYKWASRPRPTAAGIPVECVRECLSNKLLDEDKRFYYFSVSRSSPGHHSVYDWYCARGRAMATALSNSDSGRQVSLGQLDLFTREGSRNRCKEIFYSEVGAESNSLRSITLSSDELQSLENAGLLSGYKASYLNAILEEVAKVHDQVDLLDHGSASGSVPMELVLGTRVKTVTAVEPSTSGVTLLADSFQWLQSSFRGKFYFEPYSAEEYEYDRRFHVISFLGSLLFVKPGSVRAVLNEAWKHLEPGGALVIYESCREEISLDLPYYDRSFALGDLEKMLSEFGTVVRYHPSEIRTCSPTEAGHQRIFRAVFKRE